MCSNYKHIARKVNITVHTTEQLPAFENFEWNIVAILVFTTFIKILCKITKKPEKMLT